MDEVAVGKLVDAIAEAASELTPRPASAAWTTAADAGVGDNRYLRGGPHDSSVGVLTVSGDDQAPLAVMLDYACHPTVLGHQNLRYSADFPGATRPLIREKTGAGSVIFLQGAAGDVSTRFTRHAQTFAESDRHGESLAVAVLGALADRRDLDDAEPMVHRCTVRLPTRALPTEAAAAEQLRAAERAWRQHEQRDGPQARIARTRYEGALLQSSIVAARLPESVELPISAVTLGPVAWLHLPVEPFTCYGLAIKAASPYADTRVIGYTDGYFGYLADAGGHTEGLYEALSSIFDPATGDLLVAAAVELLRSASTNRTTVSTFDGYNREKYSR